MKNITGNSYYRRAEIYIKSINEEPLKTNTTQEDNSDEDSNSQAETKNNELEKIKENKLIYGIVGVILIAIVITLLVIKFKPKKKGK